MEAMYSVKSKYTYEEYKKMLKHSFRASKKKRQALALYLLFYIFFYIWTGHFIGYLSVFWVIVAAIIVFNIPLNVKNNFYKDKLNADKEEEIRFYDSFLETESQKSYFKLDYGLIDEIWESETNFYIICGARSCIMIVKETCSEELCEFIRNIKKD